MLCFDCLRHFSFILVCSLSTFSTSSYLLSGRVLTVACRLSCVLCVPCFPARRGQSYPRSRAIHPPCRAVRPSPPAAALITGYRRLEQHCADSCPLFRPGSLKPCLDCQWQQEAICVLAPKQACARSLHAATNRLCVYCVQCVFGTTCAIAGRAATEQWLMWRLNACALIAKRTPLLHCTLS
jgi:hypothetical protein